MSRLEHDPFKLLYTKYNIPHYDFEFIESIDKYKTDKCQYLQGEKMPIRNLYSKRNVGNCKAYTTVPFEYIDTPSTCFTQNDQNKSCDIILDSIRNSIKDFNKTKTLQKK